MIQVNSSFIDFLSIKKVGKRFLNYIHYSIKPSKGH